MRRINLDTHYTVSESGCWIWKGSRFAKGYGYYTARGLLAHRVYWERANGPIPAGMYVCHKCDNPPCVNPDHLFLGTPADNMTDKVKKGRQMKGGDNWTAKLTEDQVREIRGASGKLKEIAKRYGVTDVLIGLIKRGRIWKHVE